MVIDVFDEQHFTNNYRDMVIDVFDEQHFTDNYRHALMFCNIFALYTQLYS